MSFLVYFAERLIFNVNICLVCYCCNYITSSSCYKIIIRLRLIGSSNSIDVNSWMLICILSVYRKNML